MEPTGSTQSTAVSTDVAHLLDEVTRVVVATDESDEALERVRNEALRLAQTHNFDVVLYDRSNERWTDHPHPTGPLTADELENAEREHLVSQLREFEKVGVSATAWLATVPALTAMLDVLQELDVDAIMLPERLSDPKVMDRIQIGSSPSDMVQRVAELNMQRPPVVFSLAEDGSMMIAIAEEVAR